MTIPRLCLTQLLFFVFCWITYGDAAITHSHIIETVVIVDYSDYKYWYDQTATSQGHTARAKTTVNNIRAHISSLFKSSNNAFASLEKYNISMKVKLVDIRIMQTAQHSPWTEKVKYTQSGQQEVLAVDVFKTFVPYANNMQHNIPHDHAMVFTRYIIHNDNKSDVIALGVAKLSAECTPRSVSIIRDNGFTQANVIAHELGHSLGCPHDTTRKHCLEEDGYVMSKAQSVSHVNRWQFSSCSAEYIKSYITRITRNKATCMDSIQNHHHTNLAKNASWYGQLYSADQQCRLVRGDNSFFCRDQYKGNYSDVCMQFLCRSVPNRRCFHQSNGMADGTPCGPGKWCMSNKCVHTKTPVHVTAHCVAGDREGIVKYNKTCAQLVKNNPNICNDNDVKYDCCKSCHGVTTSSVDVNTQCAIKHGKGSSICYVIKEYNTNSSSDILCNKLSCFNPVNKRMCFNSLADDKTVCGSHKWCMNGKCVANKKVPTIQDGCTWSDVVGVAGYNVTCKQVAEPLNQWLCNKNSIAKMCCNTCQSVKRNSATCPFGDKADWCFTSVASNSNKGLCYNAASSDICCESCGKAKAIGSPGCEYGDKSASCDNLLPNNKHWCYDKQNQDTCCGSCAKIVNNSRPGCEYGDKSNWCKANVAQMKLKYNCYTRENLCCESCHTAAMSGNKDCRYGDRSSFCINNVAKNHYKGNCYQYAKVCCDSCSKAFSANSTGCQYGDHVPICNVHHCSTYSADSKKKCCDTCKATDPAIVG